MLSFAILNAKNVTFNAIYEDFGIFLIFKFCLIWTIQIEFLGHFFALLTKIWSKDMHHTTQTQKFKFNLFWPHEPWMTLIWHKVMKEYFEGIRVLWSVQDTSHVVQSAVFEFPLLCSAKPVLTDRYLVKNTNFDLTYKNW